MSHALFELGAPQGPNPTRDQLTQFDRCHRDALGHPATIIAGKDAKLLTALNRTHGADVVQSLFPVFFKSRDPFLRDKGMTVALFASQVAKLLRQQPKTPRADQEDWRAECDRLHGGRLGSACENPWMHRARVDNQSD